MLHDLVRFGDAEAVVSRLENLVGRVDGPLVRAMAAHAHGVVDGDAQLLERAVAEFEAMDSLVYAARDPRPTSETCTGATEINVPRRQRVSASRSSSIGSVVHEPRRCCEVRASIR